MTMHDTLPHRSAISTADEIAHSLAEAGIRIEAVRHDDQMHVTVRTPAGWKGDKGILASRVLDALRPRWPADIAGSNVAVLPAG